MTGRPRTLAYDDLRKACQACGALFGLRDRPGQSRARFERRKFCSRTCAGLDGGVEAFWTKVARGAPDDCWEWNGKRNWKGYGRLTVAGKEWGAHRLAYHLAKGDIPESLMVLHSCDNPPCCNPAHLRTGSNIENVRDCIERGRRGSRRAAVSARKQV